MQKPEKKVVLPTADDFTALGIAPEWAELIVGLGFKSVAEFKETKTL